MEFSELSNRVIGCAIEVHRFLGPGLLESTYEQCLAHELKLSGIEFLLQHPQPVDYKGLRLDCGYRVDVLVVLSSMEKLPALRSPWSVSRAVPWLVLESETVSCWSVWVCCAELVDVDELVIVYWPVNSVPVSLSDVVTVLVWLLITVCCWLVCLPVTVAEASLGAKVEVPTT